MQDNPTVGLQEAIFKTIYFCRFEIHPTINSFGSKNQLKHVSEMVQSGIDNCSHHIIFSEHAIPSL
jgi:hypothetical protein